MGIACYREKCMLVAWSRITKGRKLEVEAVSSYREARTSSTQRQRISYFDLATSLIQYRLMLLSHLMIM